MTKPASKPTRERYHVHVQAANLFADYYIDATSWKAACIKAKNTFKAELPKSQKHLARWASCSC